MKWNEQRWNGKLRPLSRAPCGARRVGGATNSFSASGTDGREACGVKSGGSIRSLSMHYFGRSSSESSE
jgi:hypothetical protein